MGKKKGKGMGKKKTVERTPSPLPTPTPSPSLSPSLSPSPSPSPTPTPSPVHSPPPAPPQKRQRIAKLPIRSVQKTQPRPKRKTTKTPNNPTVREMPFGQMTVHSTFEPGQASTAQMPLQSSPEGETERREGKQTKKRKKGGEGEKKKRRFICERGIDGKAVLGTPLGIVVECLENLGITKWFETEQRYIPSVVEEFYKNCKATEPFTLEGEVRGVNLKFTPEIIANWLCCQRPDPGIVDFPKAGYESLQGQALAEKVCTDPALYKGPNFVVGHLRTKFALLNKIWQYNIRPSGTEKLPLETEMQWMYEMFNGSVVDIPLVVWKKMNKFVKSAPSNAGYPFCWMVTYLAIASGVKPKKQEVWEWPMPGRITVVTERQIDAHTAKKGAPAARVFVAPTSGVGEEEFVQRGGSPMMEEVPAAGTSTFTPPRATRPVFEEGGDHLRWIFESLRRMEDRQKRWGKEIEEERERRKEEEERRKKMETAMFDCLVQIVDRQTFLDKRMTLIAKNEGSLDRNYDRMREMMELCLRNMPTDWHVMKDVAVPPVSAQDPPILPPTSAAFPKFTCPPEMSALFPQIAKLRAERGESSSAREQRMPPPIPTAPVPRDTSVDIPRASVEPAVGSTTAGPEATAPPAVPPVEPVLDTPVVESHVEPPAGIELTAEETAEIMKKVVEEVEKVVEESSEEGSEESPEEQSLRMKREIEEEKKRKEDEAAMRKDPDFDPTSDA